MGYSCRLCDNNKVRNLLDLPDRPIAHHMANRENETLQTYPLNFSICESCGLIQIVNPINPEILYKDFNYNFSSWKDEPHFNDEIARLKSLGNFDSVFEVGVNDGRFLDALSAIGIRGLYGVEPNQVSGYIAKSKGHKVFNSWLNIDVCQIALSEHDGQKFDLVICRQVLEHLLDLKDFFKCVDLLLSDSGYLMIDVPDMGPSLLEGDCSTIWEEHASYFTLPVLKKLLNKNGYTIFESNYYDFSGGVQSVFAKKDLSRLSQNNDSFEDYLTLGLNYKNKINKYRQLLVEKLQLARDIRGAKIVLYGSGVRACGLVNGIKIAENIDYVVDDRKERVGKYLPGTNLEIKPFSFLSTVEDPLLVLLAVNNENEDIVTSKLRKLSVKFIGIVSVCAPKSIINEIVNVRIA